MKYIDEIYNFFLEYESDEKDIKSIKKAMIDDHFNYTMYKTTYDEKTYALGKVVKTKSEYYKMYIDASNEIDNYVKKANNPDLNITLVMATDTMLDDYDDVYAKYYLFRLLIEIDTKPFYLPSNSNMIVESRKLLNYLKSIEHKKIITGQHTQTVGQEELAHIKKITGHYPKLVGYELLALSLNINKDSDKECLEEVEDNKGTMQVAMYDKSNSIKTFTWHMFSPLYGCGKSFYSDKTTFDIRKIFDEDEESEEYKAFIDELEHISKVLKHFSDYKIPILFRPFHEADGTWFWWGKYGVEYASKIYQLTYDYLVEEKNLNNLIWVWNSIGAYPGDEYVDIISVDVYENIKDGRTYEEIYNTLREKVSDEKLCAIAECDVIPDIEELKDLHFPFIYYMTWSKEFCLTEKYNSNEKLKNIYKDKDVIKN